jgi:hypothetical protein
LRGLIAATRPGYGSLALHDVEVGAGVVIAFGIVLWDCSMAQCMPATLHASKARH